LPLVNTSRFRRAIVFGPSQAEKDSTRSQHTGHLHGTEVKPSQLQSVDSKGVLNISATFTVTPVGLVNLGVCRASGRAALARHFKTTISRRRISLVFSPRFVLNWSAVSQQ
jgi:hypothetical protein